MADRTPDDEPGLDGTPPPGWQHAVAEADQRSKKPTQAERLLDIARDIELWRDTRGTAYATVRVGGHVEHLTLCSRGFRRWLARSFYTRHAKAPSLQALQDALGVLEGKALFEDTPCLEPHVRIAAQGNALFVDLCDPDWQVVEITATGWQVRLACEVPVRFVRRLGMLSLPMPEAGGRLDELRALVNVSDDHCWVLIVSWLVAALRPGRPIPILEVDGEQGSAKSTLCRALRALIDPNEAALRRPITTERDLAIACRCSWIVAFDNVSWIKDGLSDALCSVVTGGGFSTRKLFTDEDETLFSFLRPILINGITSTGRRPDLVDRTLLVSLPPLPDTRRRPEDELWQEIDGCRPRVLGALLDAVAGAMRSLEAVRREAPQVPRMADAALWAEAAGRSLGWPLGTVLRAFDRNRAAAAAATLGDDPVAETVRSLVEGRGAWAGTATELLRELALVADEVVTRGKAWPTSARALSVALRRLAPPLRRAGIELTFDQRVGSASRRIIQIEAVSDRPLRPSDPAVPPPWPDQAENPTQPTQPTIDCAPDLSECPDVPPGYWDALLRADLEGVVGERGPH